MQACRQVSTCLHTLGALGYCKCRDPLAEPTKLSQLFGSVLCCSVLLLSLRQADLSKIPLGLFLKSFEAATMGDAGAVDMQWLFV